MAADVAGTDFYTGDEGSTLTVTKPAPFAAGQILLAVAVSNSTSLASLTPPVSGWAEEGTVTVSNHQGKVWSHPFNAGDPSTWDFGYGSNLLALALIRVTGAETTPVVEVVTTAQVSLTASVDSPSITPTGADDLLIVGLGNNSDNNAASATVPSGTTTLGSVQLIGAFQALFLAKQLLASGGATGVRTWTGVAPAAHQGSTWSIAVKSAASGGATGTLAAVLPPLGMSATAVVTATGTLAAVLPALQAALTGSATVTGALAVTLPAFTASLAGQVEAQTGTLHITLPALTLQLSGEVSVAGTLAVTLPTLMIALAGTVLQDVDGTLGVTLPALAASLAGTAGAGTVTSRPDTGITSRPAGGIVTRPFTGTVTRP